MIKLKDPEGYERTLKAFAEFASKHGCDEGTVQDWTQDSNPYRCLVIKSNVELPSGDVGSIGAALLELSIKTGCSLTVFHWQFDGKPRISLDAFQSFYIAETTDLPRKPVRVCLLAEALAEVAA